VKRDPFVTFGVGAATPTFLAHLASAAPAPPIPLPLETPVLHERGASSGAAITALEQNLSLAAR
jgi:hypothetical protein